MKRLQTFEKKLEPSFGSKWMLLTDSVFNMYTDTLSLSCFDEMFHTCRVMMCLREFVRNVFSWNSSLKLVRRWLCKHGSVYMSVDQVDNKCIVQIWNWTTSVSEEWISLTFIVYSLWTTTLRLPSSHLQTLPHRWVGWTLLTFVSYWRHLEVDLKESECCTQTAGASNQKKTQ